jgi:hypothetical protein
MRAHAAGSPAGHRGRGEQGRRGIHPLFAIEWAIKPIGHQTETCNPPYFFPLYQITTFIRPNALVKLAYFESFFYIKKTCNAFA